MAFFPQFSDNTDGSATDDPTLQAINLKRKLALADSLRNTPMPQGQMVGNRYVKPSWTQYLAGAVDKGMANYQEDKALKEYADAQKTQQEKLGKAVELFGKEIGPEEIKTMKDNFVTQPLQMGANVPTSPFQTNDQVAQAYPNFNGQAPVQNMQGETSVNQPIESTTYRPRTQAEKMQAVTNFGQRTNNPDLMNKIVLGQAENIFKTPESLINKIDVEKYDPKSVQEFITNGSKDYSILKPIAKPETAGSLEKDYLFAKSQGFPGGIEDFKRVNTNYINPYQQAQLDNKKLGLFTPETIDMLTDQGLAGDKSVFIGLGRGTQGAENIAAVRENMNKKMKERGWNGADIAAKNAEFMGLMAGERTAGVKGANIDIAGNEFLNIIPLAKEASEKVSRSGFLPFGKAQIMFDEQTNNPDLNEFAAFNNGLVNTYARAISPTGIPTVQDKTKASKLLSEAKDKEAYNATVSAFGKEIEAAKKSPHQVRESLRQEISGSGGTGGGKTIHWNDLK
jgi:hypothetical protein